MIGIGEKAPDAVLKAFHKGDIVDIDLAKCRGKWLVLIFYPADFTFVCPTELEEAARMHEDFKREDALVMSVSTDTAFVHKAWHESSEELAAVDYPMLSDPTAKLCREFGTYMEDEGLSLRATFIIDPQGMVRSVEMNDNSIGRNMRETLRKLQAARFVSENKGKVCPASWVPGAKALDPGS